MGDILKVIEMGIVKRSSNAKLERMFSKLK